jgi:isopenicillin-N N-acyltransferase-like protein
METIPSLTIGEDPVERGRLHGARFTREVADNLETYLQRFEASGLARDAAEAEGLRWLDAMARQNDEYAAEMRGLAEGSGQSEGVIALLNARYEVALSGTRTAR